MTSKIHIDVLRDAEHPWDGRAGFDLMEMKVETEAELKKAIQIAEKKFWKCWICGVNDKNGIPTAIMYKPSGIKNSWEDSPENPYRESKSRLKP